MGLVSKLKAVGGAVKQKAATALGAIKKAPVSQKIGGVIGKIPAPIRAGARFGGKIISPLAKIGTAVTVVGGAVKVVKTIGGKMQKKPAKISSTSTMQRTSQGRKLNSVPLIGIGAAAAAGGAAIAMASKNPSGSAGSKSFIEKAGDWVKEHPKTTAAIVAGAGLAAAGVATYIKRRKKKKSSKRKKRKSTKRRSRSRRTRRTTRRTRKRRYGTERQYKRKGGLDVKYTKNGQPYVIQSNGRARFIKRSKR